MKVKRAWSHKDNQRKLDTQILKKHGWLGGAGEWRHPWLSGMFDRRTALLETYNNPKINAYVTPGV